MNDQTHHNLEFKLETVLDSIRGTKSIEQICDERGISQTTVLRWRQHLLENAPIIFETALSESELERQVRILQKQLQETQQLAFAGLFFGEDLHLISNKLGAARVYAKRIQRQPEDKELIVEFAASIEQNLLEVLELFINFQDSVLAPFSFEKIRLRELLRTVISVTHIPEGITVKFDPGIAEDIVFGLHKQLEQVFKVIIYNSVQAMRGNGEMSLSLTPKTMQGRDYIEVQVFDTAKGIPEEVLLSAFEVSGIERSRPSKSLGFGLAWARLFLRWYGGDISLNSIQNVGTKIAILVPQDFQASA